METNTQKYETMTFIQLYPTFADFQKGYEDSELPNLLRNDQTLKTIYCLLLARYLNDPIANEDDLQSKRKFASIIFQYGPTWEKEMELQKNLRELSLDEAMEGAKNIYNSAINPGSEPSTSSNEELGYINSQNVNKYRRSKLDAIGNLWMLLRKDVTEEFLKKFKYLFKTIVFPEETVVYGPCGGI